MREKVGITESRLSLDIIMRVSVNVWDVLFDINHAYCSELTTSTI